MLGCGSHKGGFQIRVPGWEISTFSGHSSYSEELDHGFTSQDLKLNINFF